MEFREQSGPLHIAHYCRYYAMIWMLQSFLMTKMSILYSRMSENDRIKLLQIVIKRIIVNDDGEIINIGVGEDISIADLASMIARVVGFNGSMEFDDSKPDGTPRKLLDVSKLGSLGWQAQTALHDGIVQTYAWFTENTM